MCALYEAIENFRLPRWPFSVSKLYLFNLFYHMLFIMISLSELRHNAIPTNTLQIVFLVKDSLTVFFHVLCCMEFILEDLIDATPTETAQLRNLIQILDVLGHRIMILLLPMDMSYSMVLYCRYGNPKFFANFVRQTTDFVANCWCTNIPSAVVLNDVDFRRHSVGGGDVAPFM